MRPPRTITILAPPGVQLTDVSGPLDVFAEANTQAGHDAYRLEVVGTTPGPIRSSSGVRLVADRVIAALGAEPPHTFLVAGAPRHGRPPAAVAAADPAASRVGAVAAVRVGLHRGVPAGRGRAAGRPSRDHSLGRRRPPGDRVPRADSRPGRPLRPRRPRPDLGGRNRRDGHGARAGGGGPRPRCRPARVAATRHVLQASRRPAPIQPGRRRRISRAIRPAGTATLGRCEPGRGPFRVRTLPGAWGSARGTSPACSLPKLASRRPRGWKQPASRRPALSSRPPITFPNRSPSVAGSPT